MEFVPGEMVEIRDTQQRGSIAGGSGMQPDGHRHYVVHIENTTGEFAWRSAEGLRQLPEAVPFRRQWDANIAALRAESEAFWSQPAVPSCPCQKARAGVA